MPIERVTDPDDPRVADYRDLNVVVTRRRLEGDRFFIAEGPTALTRLLTSGHRVRSVLVDERKMERLRPTLDLSGGVDTTDVPVYATTRDVLNEIVGFDLHRGVVAAADRRPLRSVGELATTSRRLVVLEGLNDPENVGAVARSARAFGADGLVLDPTCLDPYYRRAVRVSMGEILHLHVARAARWPDDLDALNTAGFETWALSPRADAGDLWDADIPDRLALVLGAEGPGLHPDTIDRCRRVVRIPIAPDVDSLNVGAAAAVALAVTARPGS